METDDEEIPTPTQITNLELDKNQVLFLVEVFMPSV